MGGFVMSFNVARVGAGGKPRDLVATEAHHEPLAAMAGIADVRSQPEQGMRQHAIA
jgi:hypothetical protein